MSTKTYVVLQAERINGGRIIQSLVDINAFQDEDSEPEAFFVLPHIKNGSAKKIGEITVEDDDMYLEDIFDSAD